MDFRDNHPRYSENLMPMIPTQFSWSSTSKRRLKSRSAPQERSYKGQRQRFFAWKKPNSLFMMRLEKSLTRHRFMSFSIPMTSSLGVWSKQRVRVLIWARTNKERETSISFEAHGLKSSKMSVLQISLDSLRRLLCSHSMTLTHCVLSSGRRLNLPAWPGQWTSASLWTARSRWLNTSTRLEWSAWACYLRFARVRRSTWLALHTMATLGCTPCTHTVYMWTSPISWKRLKLRETRTHSQSLKVSKLQWAM